MNTRSLTGTIFHASGAAWASAVVRFRLLRRFVSADGVAPPDQVSITCEANGTFSTALAVPDDGTAAYEITLPDGAATVVYLAAGSAIDLSVLLASSSASVSPDAVAVEATARADADAAHTAASDPHPQYLLLTEGDARYWPLSTDLATQAELDAHTGNTANPHAVTAAQIGAYTTGQADTLLAAKAPLNSPALTGTPTAPTPLSSDNSTRLATTAFVYAQNSFANVKAYGATGDGTTNDSSAIAAAATAAGTGGMVYFPPGSYATNSSLSPLAGQTWMGAGSQKSFIKQLSSFAGSNGLIYVNSTANVVLRDLGFTGNATNRQPAMTANAALDLLVERCASDNTTARLIICQNGSHRARVAHCNCSGTTSSNAIEFNASNYCSAEYCTLRSAASNGVELYQNVAATPIIGSRIVGCIIDGCNIGIPTFGDVDTQILGNTILNSVSYAIYLRKGEFDTTVNSFYGTVADNTLRNNGGTTLSGIQIDPEAFGWTLSGNTIEGSGLAGMNITGPNHTLIGNILSLSRAQGIALQSGATGCTVVGNVCVDNNAANGSAVGISLSSGATNNVLIGNRAYDTRGSKQQGWAIQMAAGANYNFVFGTIGYGNKFGNVSDLATGNDVSASTGGNPGVITRSTNKALGSQTVGTSQATIAHGLGYAPTHILITMTSAGSIWKSAASDSTNIYLTADSASRTAEVFAR